jgi:hypothetical protein
MGKRIAVVAGAFAAAAVMIAVVVLLNGRITTWVESPRFQDLLDRETSKGLKLTGNCSPMIRVGLLGLHTDSFTGTDGYKTIVNLQAQDISGTFNPLGVVLKRWEIDALRVKSASVMLQKTEATPGASKGVPWPPWWALFWPYRVQLADVQVEDGNILWKLQDKESGIYHTAVEITPNGHDFEYDARGGDFKTPMTPPLQVLHAHVLIRKPRLYCNAFVLGDDPAHPEETLSLQGDAGLQDDRSMQLKIDLTSFKVAPWLPEKIRAHIAGQASGHFEYTSTGTGLETGHGTGKLSIVNGVLSGLAPVREYVTVTGSPDPGDMPLKVCQSDVRWEAGAVTVANIEVECDGVFRLTGTITIAADKSLTGQVELGLSDPYLRWLPTARSNIFTRDEGPYHFTTIHFSGTAQKPEQDLSPRIAHEVGKSPALALKLFCFVETFLNVLGVDESKTG